MNIQDHEIIPLKLGRTNCFLIRGGENYVMVDAGPPNSHKIFRKKLELLRIDPTKIKLIFITHMHFDHMGSLTGISQFTGAKSAMHHLDKKLAEKGLMIMPRGIGIWGKIIPTTGHTAGSMSLVMESGEAFVGDLAMSGFPRLSGPGPFVLGDDHEAMKQSWQLVMDEGARRIYPSHGKPFDAGVFEKYLKS